MPRPAATAPEEAYVLDVRGGQTLFLVLPERTLARRNGGQAALLGVTARSARFLPNGDIALIDDALALRRYTANGLQDWLPPGSANAPLFVSPDGAYLAYLKPRDFEPGENLPLTNGVAVLDLATGQERVLLEIPGLTIHLYGWLDGKLLIEIPAWSAATLAPAPEMSLATLALNAGAAPELVARLPALKPGAQYPQTSFDQRYLAYETAGGVVVAAPATRKYTRYDGVGAPTWTEAGLSVQAVDGAAVLPWSPADLQQTGAASGQLKLPSAHALPDVAAPTGPASPAAILFYKPVAATTRVSAYFDLDPTVGVWRVWWGATGTAWQYGGSYDGHRGTDYDGVTGHPVFASWTGVVETAVVNCANTYPGGPATFGTYVRLYHGQMSDGNVYRTLYGHLKCDAVFVNTNDVVDRLPAVLAQMGNTGWSSGDHLHLQVYRNTTTAAVDPYQLGIIASEPAASSFGSLSGMVRLDNGQPAAWMPVKLEVNGEHSTFVTGGDGRYTLPEVAAGTARLTAVKGRHWGTVSANVVPTLANTAPDLVLDRCALAPTAGDGCPAQPHDNASFIEDVTIPDGMVVTPTQALTKTWRLQNTGTSTWGPGYRLVFIAGEKLPGAPESVNVPMTQPGAQRDITVLVSAPTLTGTHRSYWRLRNPQGVYFGPTIWIETNTQAPQAGVAAPAGPGPACTVNTLPASVPTPNFTVSWSGGPGVAFYDVQFLDSDRGVWRPWLVQVPAERTSAEFWGQPGHSYRFRCRSTGEANAVGEYSPSTNPATLVTAGGNQADLRVMSLTAAPGPGGGVLAELVLRNQGAASTQHGFMVDLYLNHVPSGVGDFTNSAYLWVSEPLEAGATVVLAAPVYTGGSEGNITLYALADSTGVVAETDEGNNAFTSGVTTCLAPEDAFENDDTPATAKSLVVGASQGRNLGGPGDQDWIAVNLTANRMYRATTSNLGPGGDTRLAFVAGNGSTLLALNDDAPGLGLASRAAWAPYVSGLHYLRVDHWNPGAGGCGAGYTVSLVDLGPVLRMFFPLAAR